MTKKFEAGQADNAVSIIGKSVLYEDGDIYRFGALESIAFGDIAPFVIRTQRGKIQRSNVVITVTV